MLQVRLLGKIAQYDTQFNVSSIWHVKCHLKSARIRKQHHCKCTFLKIRKYKSIFIYSNIQLLKCMELNCRNLRAIQTDLYLIRPPILWLHGTTFTGRSEVLYRLRNGILCPRFSTTRTEVGFRLNDILFSSLIFKIIPVTKCCEKKIDFQKLSVYSHLRKID